MRSLAYSVSREPFALALKSAKPSLCHRRMHWPCHWPANGKWRMQGREKKGFI